MRSYDPASATRKPCTSARPRPSFATRCTTVTRGSRDATASAIAPVPSGELSSMTSTCASGSAAWIPATIASKFSRSLYVGRRTTSLVRGASPRGEEGLDRVRDVLELRIGELRVHRQREDLARESLGHRQASASDAELARGPLQVA